MVSGWDDPRMPTISGLRRRGYTPVCSLENLLKPLGVAKRDNVIDVSLLEFCIREDSKQNRSPGYGGFKPDKSWLLLIIQKIKWSGWMLKIIQEDDNCWL